MLYHLCKDAFARYIEGYGYISSQLTRHDCFYDPCGAAFLRVLDRTPRHFDDLVARVAVSFNNLSRCFLAAKAKLNNNPVPLRT